MLRRPAVSLAVLAVLVAGSAGAQTSDDALDWPTYRRDAGRTAVSAVTLDPASLSERWVYVSPAPQARGWTKPDPRDWYNSPTVENQDALDIDSVFHVAAVGDRVFFGSATEDSLIALDAATGACLWAYTTDGPVRFAPHVVEGRVFFGSDDGHVYCVDAASGDLVWERRLAPSDYQVPSDGKFVSLWPNRTGVVVFDGALYCGMGLFPPEGVWICALDAATGSSEDPGRYLRVQGDVSLQGYVLASADNVYFPGGREGPWIFDRATGERKGQFDSGGGAYAVVSGESLITGPGRTSARLEEFGAETRDRLATFALARRIVVTPEVSFIASATDLFALDRTRYLALGAEIQAVAKERDEAEPGSEGRAALTERLDALEAEREACTGWRVPVEDVSALAVAGNHVVVGLPGRVALYRAADGAEAWSAEVEGVVKGLAIARGRLFASTDASRIYCYD